MASLLNSPTKSKSQSGVVRVKYNAASKKQEQTKVTTRQGRSQTRNAVPPTPPVQKSLASQVMASSRSSSTPPHNSVNKEISSIRNNEGPTQPGANQFSETQKKRLFHELDKNPVMSPYFKKKVASQVAKELGLNEKQIIAWFTANQKKGGVEKRVPSPVPVKPVENASSVMIKKEAPETLPLKLNKPILSDNGDIECIDLDDDDDDDALLNDSVLDKSVTLIESGNEPARPKAKEEEKSKIKSEESSKDEIVHLLMDQIKELERFVQTNSSPEMEKFKKQLNDKMLEVEQLKSDVKSKNENLQTMVKSSEDQEQRFAMEIESLKDEIANLRARKNTSSDPNVQSFKLRIAELQKLVENKEEEYYIIKNKLDLVENVSNNKVKMYKEKLEEYEKSKSSEERELRQKLETLQKDYSEKVDVVKSLESRIPKMIEEFTKYVEEKDSAHITKEKEFSKAMSDKQKEVFEANEKLKSFNNLSNAVAERTQEVKKLKLKEKEMKEALEKKQIEFKTVTEKKEKEKLDAQESQHKLKVCLDIKTNELEVKGKELQETSKKIELLQQSQSNLNEKYKKLLQSKDNELDQAEKDNLEIKEKFKKLKEENKKRTLSSKELSDLKEVKKKLKKDNEMKDKEIELKAKQMEKLEANLKDVSEKMCKLDDKNKVLEKLIAKGDSNYQKVKQELAAKTEEVTSLQISSQKLTKVNSEVKHQYNELNKIYNKALVDMKRHEKLAVEKSDEVVALKTAHATQKEKYESDYKLLKDDNFSKEEKINKLLDVLVKRGDHIRDLKAQDVELNKKLKEKDEQYQDIVSQFREKVKEKDCFAENKTKELEKVRMSLKLVESELLVNKKQIKQLEEKLKFSETQLQENASAFKEQIKIKEKESWDKSHSLKKEMQRLILDCNEKIDSKDQQLRAKALEHGRKLAEKTTELGEKIKEKELNLLKLNAKLFEKDGIIAEKESALKMASSRLQELKKGFEKQLEDKVITDINTQNNIRHELLVQQQQMKKDLMEEQEELKKRMLEEKEEMLEQFAEERANMKRSHDVVEQGLVSKIEEKRNLVKKLKNIHLYKPSENVGNEKNSASTSAPLMISYSWPLLHVSGSASDPDTPKVPLYFINEHLAVLLQLRFPTIMHTIPVVNEKTRTLKRKFEDYEFRESKKQKVVPKLLMLTYSWPLVPVDISQEGKAVFHLNFNGMSLLNLRLKFSSLKEIRLPMLGVDGLKGANNQRKVDEENKIATLEKKTVSTILRLTYCWPLVPAEPKKTPVYKLNDNGVALVKLRLRIPALKDKILQRFVECDEGEVVVKRKRKFEEEDNTVSKKPRTQPADLMLPYCWPVVPYERNDKARYLLNDDGAFLFNLRLRFVSFKDLRMPGFVVDDQSPSDLEAVVPKLLMITYSWPLVLWKQNQRTMMTLSCSPDLLLNGHRLPRSLRSVQTMAAQKRKLEEEISSSKSKRRKTNPAPMMLTYCWPLVTFQESLNSTFSVTNDEGREAVLIENFSSEMNCIQSLDFLMSEQRHFSSHYEQKPSSGKRKLEGISSVTFKRQKTTPSQLMLTYCWPLVPFQLNQNPTESVTEYREVALKEKSLFSENVVQCSDLLLIEQSLFSLQNSKQKSSVEKRNGDEFCSGLKLRRQMRKPLMLTYCWPLVKHQVRQIPTFSLTEEGKSLLNEKNTTWRNNDDEVPVSDVLSPAGIEEVGKQSKRKHEEYRVTNSKKVKVDEDECSPIEYKAHGVMVVMEILEGCIAEGERMKNINTAFHGVKRKKHFNSDLEPVRKKLRLDDSTDEFSVSYSYKVVHRTVKSLCLSTPGLYSPRKPVVVMRDVKLPKDLEDELKYLDMDDEVISDDEFEDPVFSTPASKKTKCLSSPGLCDTFPKVTPRSMPPSVEELVENIFEELSDEDGLEEYENSFFDRELTFSTPKPRTLTKCLSSPGLCGKLPEVTKRTLPAILNEFAEETIQTDDEEIDIKFQRLHPNSKSKFIGTPGLCEPFPKVTNRSLPLNISNYLEETLGDLEEDNFLEWLYLEDCPETDVEGDIVLFDEEYSDIKSTDEGTGNGEREKSFDQLEAQIEGIFDVRSSIGKEAAVDVMEELVIKAVNTGRCIITEILEETVEQIFLGSVIVDGVIEDILDGALYKHPVRIDLEA